MKRILIGVAIAGIAAQSSAAMITNTYDISLQSAQGIYSAGHVFHITAVYDNSSSVMHTYSDGLNGIAQQGGGDDTLALTYTLATSPGYTLFSDAVITISGLLTPGSGWAPRDFFVENASTIWTMGDPSSSGLFRLQFTADDLYFKITEIGPDYSPQAPSGVSEFFLEQFGTNVAGNIEDVSVQDLIGRSGAYLTSSSVPEPASLGLLAVGLAGLSLTRRRRVREAGSV